MSSDSVGVGASRRWLTVLAALTIGCALGAAVASLVACSGLGELPTLVPTLALPTAPPASAATAATASAPTQTAPFAEPGLVIPYRFDSGTGQMVPADRLSGAPVEEVDQLWVVADNAFVEYRRQESREMVAVKVITYTYDDAGRRIGWTVSWPQGPTETQRLVFLYEGLVAVGERLDVGGLVTTTYYPWATRDRNTTVDVPGLDLTAPVTDVTRYDARCEATANVDCVTLLAQVIVSEASVGNDEERRAVAWTFRNRLDRGLSLLSYAMERTPDQESYFELAREVLAAPSDADVTKGATHFFSPRSMPLQGEEKRCKSSGGGYDCDGGLLFVEGLEAPAYAPFWHLLYEWLPVSGIRKTHFLFYRIPPIQPRTGS